ncbi:MAG: tRNA (guanosine(37)-N1)-methyltransferase TrmD [Gammaproteobacteria bacterium]|nr:tRNA (guanosine(37)-N1)-methyltransferase TrmD [Gammaproteobacteria bacterium]
MQIGIVTLFPQMVRAALDVGVCGRALNRGIATVSTTDPRDHATDVHRTVDDRPFGGGPGMVLKYEPLARAIAAARSNVPEGGRTIFLSPQGRRFDQAIANELSRLPGFVLVAGRYEGFDERLHEALADEELSVGDFVLSGGEVAALAVVDAVLRLLPGALGDETSAAQDSFGDGLLDCPHYTRPEVVAGRMVPAVLVGGDHAAIARWRRKQALGRTWLRRPDLLAGRDWKQGEKALLEEYLAEHNLTDNGGRNFDGTGCAHEREPGPILK